MSKSPVMIDDTSIRVERTQLCHGRFIRVVSVFPKPSKATPEDKLKALIDLDFQGEKLCA